MNALVSFYQSSIGKKILVSITGIFLVLFVIGHMAGNLQIFLGPDWINSYAYKLHDLGALLWVIRAALLAIVVVHIVCTIQLTIMNRKARPERYAVSSPTKSTIYSRTMIWSGLIILAFIIFHLMHFTVRTVPGHEYVDGEITMADGTTEPAYIMLDKKWGVTLQDTEPHKGHNTFAMMVAGFSYWYISAFYIGSMALLFMHLSHGVASIPQTLGIRNEHWANGLSLAGRVISWVVFAGFVSIPIAILLGYGRS